MGWGVFSGRKFRVVVITICSFLPLTVAGEAFAQTATQILSTPDSQVIDTMIRNGSYAAINQDGPVLLTRWSSVPEWERRTIFSFETSSIPVRSPVSSAILTLTVKTGLGAAGTTRPVRAYRLASTFREREATWLNRESQVPWQTPGADLAESYATTMVSNVARTRVTFDVTPLVQQAVNGDLGSRQALIALVDVGGGGDVKESYREYFSSEVSTASDRPQLTVRYGTTSIGVIDVPAGGNLQQALNQAEPGTTIRLAAGATYVGHFTLPAKNGTQYIVITTGGVALPPAGTRINPGYRGELATIRSSDTMSALSTAAGASYYRIVGVAFEANVSGAGDVITLGDHAQTSLSQVPHHLELDRVLITGDPAVGQKRGVSVNAAHVSIINSDIRDIKAIGQDSQAIAGWNTPGPITITNNYLEAAGENIMFGGAHINLANVVPSDITVERNHMAKNTQWRGTSWTVKNIFELKNARRVLVRDNILEYNWSAAQAGYAVVFTPRNSSGLNPWVVIEDVEFSRNVLRFSGGAFNILGRDNTAPSGQLARLLIRDNLVHDISSSTWGGSGVFAQIGGGPRDITIDHNTVLHSGNVITFYGAPTVGFVFTNNLMKHNAYGIFGSGQAYGNGTLNYYAPGAVVRRNVLAGGSASRYPADNFFPTVTTFMANFQDPTNRDYRLIGTSPYLGAGTDGQDLGCRFQ
jgi:hypothetical protein